jgi:hypothetical protein
MSLDCSVDRSATARERGLQSVHRLFGVGLRLQALSLTHDDPHLALHLERCVDELDLAARDVCALVAKIELEEAVS